MRPVAPHPAALPPMPAVARILSQFDRPKLEGFIAVAIGLLDVLDGDPESEEDDPAEDNGDAERAAWIEWDKMRGPSKRGANFTLGEEDHEDDDPREEDDSDTAVDDLPCDALAEDGV